MNLLKEYFEERTPGKSIVYTDRGFATYIISGEECYIEDIFTSKEARRTGHGWELADMVSEVARAKGCLYLTGSVVPTANGAQNSLEALLSYGFKLLKSRENFIILKKDL